MAIESSRVLVTGGAGFIGSEVARQLAAAGNEVIIVDNLVNGRLENVQDLLGERVRLEVEDIRDAAKMRSLVDGVDVVFHLACLGVRHSIHSPMESHEVNARATLDLLIASREANVGRFVYVSSSEVYGTASTVPMTEQHPTFPMTVYGAAKLAGDCYTRAFYETYNFPTVVVRPFNTYGPNCHHEGDSGEVIPKFLLRALAGKPLVIFGDGTQTRDFTYVSDTAAGIILAAASDAAVGKTINIGNGREIPVSELAIEVASVAGRPDATVEHIEPRPGDVLRLYADTSLAQQLLGYAPTVTLRQGLEMLKQWYDAREESPEELLESEIVRNWERD